jgi:hypothetical protein
MDERLETAIDDVAREMTAMEPPASLRAGVLARLERDRGRRASGLLLPRWAWAGAAAVVVVGVAATLWLARPEPAATPFASAGPGASHPTQARTVTQPPANPVPETTTASMQPASRPGPAQQAAAPQRIGLPDDVGPAALAGPDAIDIAPLGPEAIAIPDLGVNALGEIEPLTVSTIGPGAPEPQRRDRE